MPLPQDSYQGECAVCHTVTTDWRNFEGITYCHDCLQDITKGMTNYEQSC